MHLKAAKYKQAIEIPFYFFQFKLGKDALCK